MTRSNRSNPKMMHQAGELRKEPTPAERKLWAYLRNDQLNGVNFRRQHAISSYVVDFCSPKQKLIIELDGNQHFDQGEYDTERTTFLKSRGYRVIRFWNNDVMTDIYGVLHVIKITLEENNEVI